MYCGSHTTDFSLLYVFSPSQVQSTLHCHLKSINNFAWAAIKVKKELDIDVLTPRLTAKQPLTPRLPAKQSHDQQHQGNWGLTGRRAESSEGAKLYKLREVQRKYEKFEFFTQASQTMMQQKRQTTRKSGKGSSHRIRSIEEQAWGPRWNLTKSHHLARWKWANTGERLVSKIWFSSMETKAE